MPKKFICGKDPDEKIISRCIEVLENHGVILLPTETVYGLVCRFGDDIAEDKIYRLKHRPQDKRLSVFVDDIAKLSPYGVEISPLCWQMAMEYCPGAITLITARNGNSSIGFRIPDHDFVLKLLKAVNFPLSSTSANRSGMPNVLNPEQAVAELDGEVDIIIDGGSIAEGALASTVVDCRGEKAVILRQGALIINNKFTS